jgi:aspartyl-tRNA(Asn)/glutamyl-tRNA(Gln) amidotransferase subunit A
MDLTTLSIKVAREGLSKGSFTAVDLAKAYLANVAAKDGQIHAYLEVYSDVIAQAEAADARIKAGEKGTLLGIPFAIKDNILIDGCIASAASKILETYKATYDATAISKLKAEGAVFIGRANMDEFALGGSTEKSAYGPTHNPHDLERVPGGTSGGSAAVVAAHMALVALGSDTGGSVRQPASFCGVVGLKPTYGSVSRHGLMAAASSLDVIGPIGRSVADVETVFDAIRGKDRYDATSVDVPGGKVAAGTKLVIGIPRALLKGEGIDPAVLSAFAEAEAKFKLLGYDVRDIELPNAKYALPAYYIINFAEVSSNLARFDGVKYGTLKPGADLLADYVGTRGAGFGKEAKRRIILGTYVLSSGYYDAYYNKANALRALIAADYREAFGSVDLVLTPTAPGPAYKIGEKESDPVSMYLADVFTVTANLTGLPAMSVPAGSKDEGGKKLPVGVQLTATWGKEGNLFRAGKDFLGETE